MNKLWHEIRDPIHTFVRLDSEDRLVLDSTPFQRLRDIQQLSMSHFVYPGATHKRFEHSLGVMELASRAYDSLTQPHKIEQVRGLLDQLDSPEKVARWRRVVRMAALCHDMGHFPFSHASEHLLPAGWDHERMSRALIFSEEMQDIWQKGMDAPMRAEEIADLAVGPDPDSPEAFPAWKAVLKEIITSDVFGVDRMDYLLRDSHHTGVAYGRFDHHRLIDTLRFLPEAPTGDDGTDSEGAPTLGVEEGGLQSAEQLLLARYFMFSQVYLHRVRRIYDIHLSDFLTAMLRERGGHLPTDPAEHLAMSDVEVVSEMRIAADDSGRPGHDPARRILRREHFRVLYTSQPADRQINPDPSRAVYDALVEELGDGRSVRRDRYSQRGASQEFPVLVDGKSESSTSLSDVLRQVPPARTDCVYVAPEIREEAERWLKEKMTKVLES
jgi:HD superfamily phosphohydrolase